jgi:hypothetical protein
MENNEKTSAEREAIGQKRWAERFTWKKGDIKKIQVPAKPEDPAQIKLPNEQTRKESERLVEETRKQGITLDVEQEADPY